MTKQPARWRARLRALQWGRIAAGLALVLAIVAFVPPLRRAAADAASKVILFVAAPLAPSVGNFNSISANTRIVAADGSEIAQLNGGQARKPVTLAELPPHVVHAVLAAEDADFYHHGGVDLVAIARAVGANLRGAKVQGGSTITQQLAKLNYTGSQRTAFRKFKELLYASKLEQQYSKNQLLERYVNQVYLGHGAYGIGAASEDFFGVTPDKLTPAQAAALAGKIRAPSQLDPRTAPAAVIQRRDQVLHSMRKHGWLSDAELRASLAEPLQVQPAKGLGGQPGPLGGDAAHFVQFVIEQASGLDELGGSPESRGKQLFTGGYTIETTLDPKALAAATASIRDTLGRPGDPSTTIVSVQPGDGAVRVLTDGLDTAREFLVATHPRQPGSSFKPYVYLAMLEAGIDPRSVLDSGAPKTVTGECRPPYTVKNYEGHGGGPMDIDKALAESVNAVFAQLAAKVGPPAMQKVAERAGIRHDEVNPPRCPMALGGLDRGVTPLEQAAAYATFAANGTYAAPYGITRITDRRGRVVYRHAKKTFPAFPDKEVGVLNGAMQGVVDHGTGTAAKLDRPVAGKTGTTENSQDAWFIGYTPQLATAVWVGHPEGAVPMTNVHGINVTGGSFPARMFGSYMKAALAGQPPLPLFTASPDELGLKPFQGTFTGPPSIGTSSTPESTPPTSSETTTSAPESTTTTRAQSTTTAAPKSTTTAPAPTTTQPP
ncbi:MAG: Multimodular transpeptidase-transglycosylase [Acidimicrobiales bacterium]|jgi:membrane peptidoglycan carboxypeptidase|nr:Multimodular transpeptidase-transglycosylase [Acidimicrobiales bacterium]